MTATETNCPCCDEPRESHMCFRCGYVEQIEMPVVEFAPKEYGGGNINCTGVCGDCGVVMEPYGGELVCTACMGMGQPQKPAIRKMPSPPIAPDPITPEFLLCRHEKFANDKYEPCNRDLIMATNKTPAHFECAICKDVKQVPGAPLSVVSTIVQTVENVASALRSQKRRR